MILLSPRYRILCYLTIVKKLFLVALVMSVYYIAELAGGHEKRTQDIPVPYSMDAGKLHLVVQLSALDDAA